MFCLIGSSVNTDSDCMLAGPVWLLGKISDLRAILVGQRGRQEPYKGKFINRFTYLSRHLHSFVMHMHFARR